MNDNFDVINVSQALSDKNSIFYHYQKLIKLRHELDIITTGKYELIDASDKCVYTYKRTNENQELLVINNFTESVQSRHYEIPENANLIISNYKDDEDDELRPFESKVYSYSV